jgi:hypothetical protein
MGDQVQCILVGDEYHSVEGHDGVLLTAVGNLTEQCDQCGSAGDYVYDDRSTRTAGIVTSHPGFSCLECGRWYKVVVRDAAEVVF